MNSFFVNFGTVWFTLPDGNNVLLNDITKFVDIDSSWQSDPRLVLDYQIRDSDRPDKISYRLYDTDKYWWSILLINDIWDITNQWPMNDIEFAVYLENKYPFQDPSDIIHYTNIDGQIVDITAIKLKYGLSLDADAVALGGLTAVSILDYETNLNDAKRKIVVVDPDYIGQLDSQLKALFT